jgi:hypothetical protein
MFAKRSQRGHVLIIVIVISFLFALFMQGLMQAEVLEYQRLHNQILEQQLWQQLEVKIYNILNKLQINTPIVAPQGKILGYVPDTLELYCPSGTVIYELEASLEPEPVKLLVTYSLRK